MNIRYMNYETFSDFFPSLEQEDVSFCVECGPPCRIGLGGRRNGTNIFPHLLSVTDYSHFLEDILVLPPSCDRLVDKAWIQKWSILPTKWRISSYNTTGITNYWRNNWRPHGSCRLCNLSCSLNNWWSKNNMLTTLFQPKQTLARWLATW